MLGCKDFSIFAEPEEIADEVVMIVVIGGVNGCYNISQKLYADFYNAAVKGYIAKAKVLQPEAINTKNSTNNYINVL